MDSGLVGLYWKAHPKGDSSWGWEEDDEGGGRPRPYDSGIGLSRAKYVQHMYVGQMTNYQVYRSWERGQYRSVS